MRLDVIMVVFLFLAAGCAGLSEKIEKYLPPEQPAAERKGPVVDEGKSLFINTGTLNLRACPGLNCQILTTLKRGEEVIKIGEQGEWLKVQVKAAKTEGWVASRFVSSKPLKPVMTPPPEQDSSKPQEEWAVPDKGTKPPPSLPKEGFAK